MNPIPNGVPDRHWCLHLMARMEMAGHIAAHSLRVWQVASCIAQKRVKADSLLDIGLVTAGALLHDITKTRSLTTGENHAATGESLLQDLGLAQVGRLVRQHVSLAAYPPKTLDEAVIVNYADKRVIHDQVVTLARRGDYILKTYGRDAGQRRHIRRLWVETEKIEARLFKDLPLDPDNLIPHLDSAAFDANLREFRRRARLDI